MTNYRNICRIQSKNKSPSAGIWCVLAVLHKSSFMYVHVFLLGIRNGELMFNSTLEILLTLCNAWRYWLLFFQALHERCREYFWQYIIIKNESYAQQNDRKCQSHNFQIATITTRWLVWHLFPFYFLCQRWKFTTCWILKSPVIFEYKQRPC